MAFSIIVFELIPNKWIKEDSGMDWKKDCVFARTPQ